MAASLGPEQQRADQWLWFSRLVKSRTLAQALIERGKVRINKVKMEKPSHMVRPGDVLTLSMGPRVRVIEIRAIGLRRGPAVEAAQLFQEIVTGAAPTVQGQLATAASKADMPNHQGQVVQDQTVCDQAVRDFGSGRPTKRERRQTDRLKSRFNQL